MGIVVDSAGTRLYTANYASGDVSVIDARTMAVLDTIDVPGKPSAISISGGMLYVADRAGRKVYAINAKTHRTTATFATGRGPCALALDPKADRLFVANSEGGSVWVYALSSGRRISSLAASSPAAIAVDTAEHKLYTVASLGVLYTHRTGSLVRVGTTYGGSISSLAVDAKRQRLYSLNSSILRERNLLTGGSRTIDTEIHARVLTVDATRRIAYVVDPDTGAIQAVSLK